jgi:hypothetical protein
MSANADGRFEADALVKLRLVHAKHGSVLFPDHVLVRGAAPFWLQPQWFYAPVLHFADRRSTVLHLGIANLAGSDLVIEVHIDETGFLAELSDESQLYACRISSAVNPTPFRAGRWRRRPDGGVDLPLYHHTTRANKKSIVTSQEIWGSAWNFQGDKKLLNCSYAYFTSLRRIESRHDLQRIGMASDGRLLLRLDQTPTGLPPDAVLDVYRESTENRQHGVSLWVPAEHIAPTHVWMHKTSLVEYELAHPWIYRVGLVPAGHYRFAGNKASDGQPDLKRFRQVVIGDCQTTGGLAAPYDEEDTSETFLLENLAGATVFDFWLEHANQELWHADTEKQEFGDAQ